MDKQSKATSSEFSLQESVIKVFVLIENAMYRTLLEGVRLCERRIPYILWNTGIYYGTPGHSCFMERKKTGKIVTTQVVPECESMYRAFL